LGVRIGFITLGCDKNTVDSERYLARLVGRGAEHVSDLAAAEVIVVNTCGFIDAAKKESIDALIEAGRLKEDGSCQAVVAVGCMVERHKQELLDHLPEVDLFLGSSEMDRLVPELERRGVLGDPSVVHPGVRVYTGELPHVRYLKVSEGCDHGCAFCAIPLMRGRHRSFSLDELLYEARELEQQGAMEVNLVAQDLAHYGRDLRGSPQGRGVRLPELLEALLRETSIPWFRMLYLYSAGLTPRLLEVVSREPRITPYLDMPIQHASDAVLERMRRPERERTIREKVRRVREAVPDVAIRTTCIVGFPGETEADFQRLLEFLEEIQFERVGAFTYSPQEGTRAYEMRDDVPDDVKRERLERLLGLQRALTAERYERFVGRRARGIVDRCGDRLEARAIWQADDIDGITWLDGDAPPGSIVDMTITAVEDDYDFVATQHAVVATAPLRTRTRAPLPVVSLTSIGSFGR
jgi:ribosomal protein S12 methylthiotransferase